MCQNTMDDCNDYSLLTANTGLTTIALPDSSLTGAFALTVLTAGGANGTIVKSIIIKAMQPTTQGMVRLFIQDTALVPNKMLYKEVIIPIQPEAPALPVPTPKYTMFEVMLDGGLKLQSGYKLLASTQNAETFNVIAEGLDWKYPEELPGTCCNFEQDAAGTGIGMISVATSIDGSTGTIEPIFTADAAANGALIKAIIIKALQSTHPGIVRLYISPDAGTTWFLMQEVSVPQTTQSAYEPSFKQVLNMNYNLQAGYIIGAATDIAQSFAITIEATNWTYPI